MLRYPCLEPSSFCGLWPRKDTRWWFWVIWTSKNADTRGFSLPLPLFFQVIFYRKNIWVSSAFPGRIVAVSFSVTVSLCCQHEHNARACLGWTPLAARLSNIHRAGPWRWVRLGEDTARRFIKGSSLRLHFLCGIPLPKALHRQPITSRKHHPDKTWFLHITQLGFILPLVKYTIASVYSLSCSENCLSSC